MHTVYITIGLPASGKSYYYGEMLHEKLLLISSNNIRELVYGDINDQSHNSEVFNLMFNRTVAALKNDYDVYYDATNISRRRRMGFIKSIRQSVKGVKVVGLIFAIPYTEVFSRNKKRDRQVPKDVITRMLKSFEVPSYEEGFDGLKVINSGAFDIKDNTFWDLLNETSHNNPHHSLSIGEHMLKAVNLYIEEACEYDSTIAAAIHYHDIGKLFCKTFKNFKGEKTDVAHYYGHENVSAYMYLSSSTGTDRDLYIALLINHHMDFFKEKKYLMKVKNIYGESFMEDLEIVHKYDVLGH